MFSRDGQLILLHKDLGRPHLHAVLIVSDRKINEDLNKCRERLLAWSKAWTALCIRGGVKNWLSQSRKRKTPIGYDCSVLNRYLE